MVEYQVMDRPEMKACVSLAAEAFSDYEYFKLYIPRDTRRRIFLKALIRCEFKANIGLDTVRFLIARENGKILAVAQLCSPDFIKPSDKTYVRSGWLGVLFKGGPKATNAWNNMEHEASAPCHSLSGKTWYLSLLTVDRSSAGKGIGSRMLRDCVIPYVQGENAEALCLFTNTQINCRFYEKNGFELFDEKHFEYNGGRIGSWSYIMRF